MLDKTVLDHVHSIAVSMQTRVSQPDVVRILSLVARRDLVRGRYSYARLRRSGHHMIGRDPMLISFGGGVVYVRSPRCQYVPVPLG